MTRPLTPDLVKDTTLWRLFMEVRADVLEVVMYSAVEDQTLHHWRIELDSAAASPIAAFEEAVYENPLLLCNFERTCVLVDTRRYMLVPKEFEQQQTFDAIADAVWPNVKTTVVVNDLPVRDMRLMMAVDHGLMAFVRRTFPRATVLHPMTALITYFFNKDRLNSGYKMYVHLRRNSIDIIAFNVDTIALANTYDVSGIDDMLYFIHLAADNTGFDMHADEIMVSGDTDVRNALTAELRRYAAYVMPVLFPSAMYHAGKASLESPFELIVLPLCV